MRIETIGEGNIIEVWTTARGVLKKIIFNDTEVPLEFVEDVSTDWTPMGTIVRGSFSGVARIRQVEE